MILFESNEYLRDKNKFFFLDEYRNCEFTLFDTDNEKYAIARTHSGCPTYVWTKDNLTDDEYEYISKKIYSFIENGESRFTTKEAFYNYLKRVKCDLLVSENPFILGFLQVRNLIKPKECEGIF